MTIHTNNSLLPSTKPGVKPPSHKSQAKPLPPFNASNEPKTESPREPPPEPEPSRQPVAIPSKKQPVEQPAQPRPMPQAKPEEEVKVPESSSRPSTRRALAQERARPPESGSSSSQNSLLVLASPFPSCTTHLIISFYFI